MRHPAAVLDSGAAETDPGSGLAVLARGPEHRVAARTLATLLFLAGLIGSANLFVDDMVRQSERWLYGGTMALCMGLAVLLALRRSATRPQTFALVLLGDLVYVVVSRCLADPIHYTTPLALLFPCFVAAWFLGRWQFAVNLVVTPIAVVLALVQTHHETTGLTVQLVVNSGILTVVSLAVFVLRRRVERLIDAMRALSVRDPLTGLHNRRYLVDQAPRVWRQARRDGTRVAAMVLDLDHFKALNDLHGHAAGDGVLRTVAAALAASVRPADVLARTGGEEFVVLGLVGDAAEAGHLAERLRAAVAAARTQEGHAVTASIGVALTRPADGEDVPGALWRLVDRADAAMYEAKQQGRDRVAAQQLPHPRPARVVEPPSPPEPVRDPFPETPASDVA
ncbi:diguanylate cyclase [Blastococcus sp. SYSU D00669]